MTRSWMLVSAAAVCLLCAGVLLGREGVVTDKQGNTYEGDVTEDGEFLKIVNEKGVPTRVQKANVESIEYADSVEEQFKQRMAKLKDNDSSGRVAVARWAYEKREYSLALDALDAAIDIDPDNQDARELKRTILKQQELDRKKPRASPPAGKGKSAPKAPADDAGGDEASAEDEMPAEEPGGGGEAAADDDDAGERPAARRGPAKRRMVTPREINRIRQLEWQKGDRVAVRLENDVKRRYLAQSDFTPQEFNKMTPPEQAFEILDNGPSRLHRDVIIVNDPYAIAQFKSVVQRHVLAGCATAGCHGGTKAGDFVLHSPANKDVQTYTNFILLQDYKLTDDDGREHFMIDRAHPEDSLLTQYGLPQRDADMPHPKAQNFRPLFKGHNDPRYKAMVGFIEETLARQQPDYGIDLTEPAPDDEEGSTTRPSRGGTNNSGGRSGGSPDADDDDDSDRGDAAEADADR